MSNRSNRSIEVEPAARRSRIGALFAALRPRQWTKNLVVFAAIALSGQLTQPALILRTLGVFAIFSAVASAVYLLNDTVDAPQDRLHPDKRLRPIASGALGTRTAIVASGVLALAGVLAAIAMARSPGASRMLLVAVVGYLLLQLTYIFALKHIVIVDVLSIAGGFVFRVLAGGAAIDTVISPYLYLSMINLALFQGFAKRQNEIKTLADSAGGHRRSLDDYTPRYLDQLITIAAASTIVTYALYAITTPHRPESISPNALLITVPFVMYGLFRYLYLVQVRGAGGAPEDILLRDKPFLLDVIAWALVLVFILYGIPTFATRWSISGS